MRLVRLLIVLLLLPLPLLAAPAVTCHCFRDRAYDPQRPGAADDYFLANLQNSLFAAVSATDKRAVVQAKMAGAAGDELWVRWALGASGRTSAAALAEARNAGSSWRETVKALKLPLDQFDPALARLLQRDAGTAELAAAVVDVVLRQRLAAGAGEVAALRRAGAGDRQAIAAVVLARHAGRTPGDWLAAVQRGGQSWSGLLQQAGIGADNAESTLRRLLQK